jgi:hypothetical protein
MTNTKDDIAKDYWRPQVDVDTADDGLVVRVVDQPLRADGQRALRIHESLRFLVSQALPDGRIKYVFERADIPSHRSAAARGSR